MPRILLLMATKTYRAASFMTAAARLDLSVAVGSDRTQALASANPEGHLTLDFDRPEAAAEKIVRFAREVPVHAILAADDDGVIPAALASAELGLAYNPVAAVRAARDKGMMREVLAAAGLPGPEFRSLSVKDDAEAIATGIFYPCVLKPRSLAASRGVIRADDPEGFVAAFARVARILEGEGDDSILVEEYIPGDEVAVEGLLTEGDLRILAVYDKPDPMQGPYFEETIYVTPSRKSPDALRAAYDCVQAVVRALGLTHGPVHAELRLGDHGAVIIEIAPRSIGGHCSRTLRFGQGASLEELILRHALGMNLSGLERESRAAGVMMIPIPAAGVLEKVEGRAQAAGVPGVEEVEISIRPGQEVVPPPEGSRYLGFIFARAEGPEQAEAALRQAHGCLAFRIQPLQSKPGSPTMSAEPHSSAHS